jgi:hypothetical protein
MVVKKAALPLGTPSPASQFADEILKIDGPSFLSKLYPSFPSSCIAGSKCWHSSLSLACSENITESTESTEGMHRKQIFSFIH